MTLILLQGATAKQPMAVGLGHWKFKGRGGRASASGEESCSSAFLPLDLLHVLGTASTAPDSAGAPRATFPGHKTQHQPCNLHAVQQHRVLARARARKPVARHISTFIFALGAKGKSQSRPFNCSCNRFSAHVCSTACWKTLRTVL